VTNWRPVVFVCSGKKDVPRILEHVIGRFCLFLGSQGPPRSADSTHCAIALVWYGYCAPPRVSVTSGSYPKQAGTSAVILISAQIWPSRLVPAWNNSPQWEIREYFFENHSWIGLTVLEAAWNQSAKVQTL
jgi:hypothetical protein